MAYSDDATKAWVSAIPTINNDGNVREWRCKYQYTLAVPGNPDYVHVFDKDVRIETPSKAPASYTKAEILVLMDVDHWDNMFNKKYTIHIAIPTDDTEDGNFDVNSLNDS